MATGSTNIDDHDSLNLLGKKKYSFLFFCNIELFLINVIRVRVFHSKYSYLYQLYDLFLDIHFSSLN